MSDASSGPAANKQDYSFGQVAIRENLCTFEQVKECLDIQSKLRTLGIEPKKLGDILVEKGYLTPEQVAKIGRLQSEQSSKTKFQVPGYELISKIGAGAMGVVYKAKQLSMDRIVAIKVLGGQWSRDRAFVERFQREARAVAKLNHENVISGIDVGEINGVHYFVMEYVDGAPVTALMRKEGRLGERRCLEIGLHVAKALAHAHRHGIVHRDVKPENIMITSSGVSKLCDLGLAKSSKGDVPAETLDGQSVGTPNYISPEQARAEEKIDIRTDIYSLGCSLYHMATGTTPFTGPNPMVVMTKHVTEYAEPPKKRNAQLSDGFNALVVKMMGKRREERHADPEALIQDIEGLLRGAAVPSSGPPTARAASEALRARGERSRPPSTVLMGGIGGKKSPLVPAIIAAAVLGGAGLAFLVLGGRSGDPPPPAPRPPAIVDADGPRPPAPAGDPLARVRAQVESFRKFADAQLAENRADRFTFSYGKIQENIEIGRRESDFAAVNAWQEELARFTRAANEAIAAASGWEDLKKASRGHSAAGRYSQALEEANKLKDVYRWFRVEPPAVPTAAGKEREELVAEVSTALRDAHYQTMKQAQAAFANPKTRDDAYGILDTLVATGAPDKRPEVEGERRRFLDIELRELAGEKADARIAELKKLHAGNGPVLAFLDQAAAGIRQGQVEAVKAAAARAVEAFEKDFRPRYGAALKARDVGGARRALHDLLFPASGAAASTFLASPSTDAAVVKAWLDPARSAPSADLRKVVAAGEEGAGFASGSNHPAAKEVYLALRKTALLEDLFEQALEGSKAASRDATKFKTGYSPVLQAVAAAEPAPRKAGEFALSATLTVGPKVALLVSPKGASAVTLSEDDIVALAKRAPSAASDPYFALKAYLLYDLADNLKGAKTWYERLTTPQLQLGLEGQGARFAGVTSEAMEAEAKLQFEDAWKLYHVKKDVPGGKKKFLECVQKFGVTDYMRATVPTLGKTRIDVVQAMFGEAGGGGSGGAGAPAGKALKDVLATAEVRDLGRNRYEVTYSFKDDKELALFATGDGNVSATRDPLGGAVLNGNGAWYWSVPLKGSMSIEVQFRMAQPGPFGLIVCGDGNRTGYAGVADLPIPGLPPLDALLRFPLGGAQFLTAMVAQAGANLGTQAGPNQASLVREGTRLRYTINRGIVEGDNAQYSAGKAGIAVGNVPTVLDRVKITGEIDKDWLDAALK
jgi:serine/threonine-protein kinase